MYHQIALMGRLGRDPEMRYTQDGKAVVSFSVAVDDGWGDKKSTMWWRVSIWGEERTKFVMENVKKGMRVHLTGRVQFDKQTGGPRVYNKQDGTAAASFEMTASEITVIWDKRTDSTPDTESAASPEDMI